MDKTDKIKQEEFPLPRYVQEVLSKHNISLPSLWGRGKGGVTLFYFYARLSNKEHW